MNTLQKIIYTKANMRQLKQWASGKWVHCPTNDECTPDFGCCFSACKERDSFKRRMRARDKLQYQRESLRSLEKLHEAENAK